MILKLGRRISFSRLQLVVLLQATVRQCKILSGFMYNRFWFFYNLPQGLTYLQSKSWWRMNRTIWLCGIRQELVCMMRLDQFHTLMWVVRRIYAWLIKLKRVFEIVDGLFSNLLFGGWSNLLWECGSEMETGNITVWWWSHGPIDFGW